MDQKTPNATFVDVQPGNYSSLLLRYFAETYSKREREKINANDRKKKV